MLAKGNRSRQVTQACEKHGGFYLGSIGGPAARLAQDCIRKVEVLEYSELGMEAIWQIEVEDFPAFIVVDDKGNDFFRPLYESQRLSLHTRHLVGVDKTEAATKEISYAEETYHYHRCRSVPRVTRSRWAVAH